MHRTSPQRQEARERSEASLLSDSLRSIARTTSRCPRATLFLVFLSACVSVGYAFHAIDLKTDRADLLAPQDASQQSWQDYTKTFGGAKELVAVVEAESPALIRQAIDDLGARMTREPEHFTNVLYRVEPGRLRQKGIQYLGLEQLQEGLDRLDAFAPVLRGQWSSVQLEQVLTDLQSQLAPRPAYSSRRRDTKAALERANRLAVSLDAYLADPNDFRSPWVEILPVDQQLRDGGEAVYFLNNSGTMGYVRAAPVTAADTDDLAPSISRLRELVAEIRKEHADVKISLTGLPILGSDEVSTLARDMLVASGTSFLGVGLVLVLGFRGLRHPLLALVMLVVGIAWALGFTTLTVGRLNILSISFAVILVGLGIDYATHFLTRYLELRHEGHPLRPALKGTATGVGGGIVTTAVTTSLAFFCASLTEFPGVAELGIIAGGGILLCAVAAFFVLPSLIALADAKSEPHALPKPFQGNLIRGLVARFPRVAVIVSVAIVAGLGLQALRYEDGRVELRTRYDGNLLNLHASGLDSIEVQRRMFDKGHDSLLYAVAIAHSADEARALRRQFEALPTVHHVEELASRLPGPPPEATRRHVQAFQADLSRLPAEAPRFASLSPRNVGTQAERLYTVLRSRSEAEAVQASKALDRFLDRFTTLSARDQSTFLDTFQRRAATSLLQQFHALAAATDPRPVRLSDLPPELTSRFVSREGDWLLQIHSNESIWDHEPLERFVQEIRSVAPGVTGTPVQNYESGKQVRHSYELAAFYALAVIALVLLIDFLGAEHRWLTLLPPLAIVGFAALLMHTRRIDISPLFLVGSYVAMVDVIAAILKVQSLRDTLLALLPPVVGGAVTFGVLGLLGIPLNPANLIVLPLILGIGVDEGVHIVHDFAAQRGRYRMSGSTMNAITLTSLTTMVGFGSLMIASHRGIHSVGVVLAIGVASCMFVSLILLPAILTVLSGGAAETAAAGGQQARRDDTADARAQQHQQQKRRAA